MDACPSPFRYSQTLSGSIFKAALVVTSGRSTWARSSRVTQNSSTGPSEIPQLSEGQALAPPTFRVR
jgi:hypothetical protein